MEEDSYGNVGYVVTEDKKNQLMVEAIYNSLFTEYDTAKYAFLGAKEKEQERKKQREVR
ncbi:MAG: hypothetical protein K6G88_08820 [Lachnospiraceae bacterium]|nr:hypothetical protein [Lachnospiraceae bacterium]